MVTPNKPQRTTRVRVSGPPAAAPPAEDSAEAVKTPQRVAIDAAFLDQAELRAGLRENLEGSRIEADRVAERVQTAFEAFNPSGLSAEDLTHRNHVARGSDPSATLDKVIQRRLGAIRKAKPRSTLRVQRGGSSAKLVKTTKAAGGSVDHTIKLGPLVDFIEQRQDGLTAIAATSVGASCIAEMEADQVIAAIDAPPLDDTATASPSADGGTEPATVDELVERTVNRQMQSATAPEARPEYAAIPSGADSHQAQAALLQTFELRPGASDVTSYHDFNMLQIAFEHVWTQMFDGEIEDLGRELYREYVGLKDFLGYTAPDTPISTLDDLRRLMAEIQELSKIAQDAVPGTPDGGGTKQDDTPKGAGDIGSQFLNDFTTVATGGLSELVKWALNEISHAGEKPILPWSAVNGGPLARGDRIRADVEYDVAPSGTFELALQTDLNSNRKDIAFQLVDRQTGPFNAKIVTNANKHIVSRDGSPYLWASEQLPTPWLAIGLLEFDSEETPGSGRGRYVLADLSAVKDRSRVTFYWTDS